MRQNSRTNSRARRRSLRSLRISSSERASGRCASPTLHGHAGQVVAQPIGLRKRHGGLADRIHERFRLELAVDPHALREAVCAVELAGEVAHFRDPIRVEQEQIARLERDGDLVEDLSLADPQRQIVAVQDLARAGLWRAPPSSRYARSRRGRDAAGSGRIWRSSASRSSRDRSAAAPCPRGPASRFPWAPAAGRSWLIAIRWHSASRKLLLVAAATSAAGMPLPMTSATITSRHWFSCLKKS